MKAIAEIKVLIPKPFDSLRLESFFVCAFAGNVDVSRKGAKIREKAQRVEVVCILCVEADS